MEGLSRASIRLLEGWERHTLVVIGGGDGRGECLRVVGGWHEALFPIYLLLGEEVSALIVFKTLKTVGEQYPGEEEAKHDVVWSLPAIIA